MRKVCCLILALIIIMTTVICISAETENVDEEKFVSGIYNQGPEIEAVYNKTFESLTENELFSYCLDKYMYSQGSPFDVYIKGESFSEKYFKMFGTEFELIQGKEYEYTGKCSFISKNYGHDSVYYVDDQNYIKPKSIDSGSPYVGYYKHFLDYFINDDYLSIDIGLLIIDPDNVDEKKMEFLNYVKSISESSNTDNDDQDEGSEDDDTVTNYFSNKHDIWDKYSNLYTVYTMNYQKNSEGEWHWTSCVLKNPSTSDKPNMIVIYSLLFISMTAMTLIICIKKHRAIFK